MRKQGSNHLWCRYRRLSSRPCIFVVMMLFVKHGALLLFLVVAVAGPAHSQQFSYGRDYEKILKRTADIKDTLSYSSLLSHFQKGDSTLTVFKMLCLMIGYTGQANYKPYKDLETEKLILGLNNAGKHQEAIAICDTFLQRHPLNQAAIIEKAFAYHRLNQMDSAALYKEQFGKIMAAMDWSGNGSNPDEAIFSVGPQDGRNFIDKYYHADLGRIGSAEDSNGNFCEQLEMLFKKQGRQQSVVLYFAIQHAVNTTSTNPEK